MVFGCMFSCSHAFIAISLSNFLHFSGLALSIDFCSVCLKDDQENILITSPNLSEWVRLRIIENSEINGVRFPKGVVIDVSHEDGDRLLESGKAAYVNEDEIETFSNIVT